MHVHNKNDTIFSALLTKTANSYKNQSYELNALSKRLIKDIHMLYVHVVLSKNVWTFVVNLFVIITGFTGHCLWNSLLILSHISFSRNTAAGSTPAGFSATIIASSAAGTHIPLRAGQWLDLESGDVIETQWCDFWSHTLAPKETEELVHCHDGTASFHISKDKGICSR